MAWKAVSASTAREWKKRLPGSEHDESIGQGLEDGPK